LTQDVETKRHHFVPEWYQRLFLPDGRGEFWVFDKQPETHKLCPDGKVRTIRNKDTFRRGPHALFQRDNLYSIKLRGIREDAIERLLFGNIDDRGAKACRMLQAWPGSRGFGPLKEMPKEFGHPSERMQDLLEFINAQKIRTPKGIDQVKRDLATRGQIAANNNAVMDYLVRRRQRNCTVWAESIWEIFSAEQSDLKFILSDDPVVIYNCDCFPASNANKYPNDPHSWWRGSRVLYPLGANRLLVMSHAEHMDDPSRSKAKRDRRNARAYDMALLNYTDIVNDRTLSREDIAKVNWITKSRATRYVASTDKQALYPEREIGQPRWSDLDRIFYGKYPSMHGKSEVYVKYRDGSLLTTNAFGEHVVVPAWFIKEQEAKGKKSSE